MATLLVMTALIPLFVSLGLFVTPRLEHRAARQIALAAGLLTLALSLILVANFKSGLAGPQFASVSPSGEYGVPWFGEDAPKESLVPATRSAEITSGKVSPNFNIRFAMGLDGLSLWLFFLTALLSITAVFSSWSSIQERVATHYALLLLLETAMLVLFASLDAVLFLVAFEFTLIPLFFLIGIWGGPERRRAATTFFIYTLAGSLFTLLGVISLVAIQYLHAPDRLLTFSIPELTKRLSSLNWSEWSSASSWSSPQVVVFLLLFAGFAIKVPIFPFHTWLPLAYVEAPTAGTVLLSGVMSSVGTYGLFRFNVGMTPLGVGFLFPLLSALCVTGIIYGAFAALAQTDIKRMLAYSSFSHMGFIALGLFALNGTAMDGAAVHMLNHGLAAGALFACVGIIFDRYQTREMGEIGGLWNRWPLLAFALILASLASAALPGLNGFVGEFPILIGTFAASPRASVLAATGMVFGTVYLLLMLKNIVFGPLHEPSTAAATAGQPMGAVQAGPIAWHEIAGLAPVMVLIVAFGVIPGPILDQMRPAVAQITPGTEPKSAKPSIAPRVSPAPTANLKAASAASPSR
jgi:NADH-quinone oxidoreductase subunit M